MTEIGGNKSNLSQILKRVGKKFFNVLFLIK